MPKYSDKHVKRILEDYWKTPPFEYAEEVRPADLPRHARIDASTHCSSPPSSSQAAPPPKPARDPAFAAEKGWTPNRHPGPLLVAGSRRPNGAFYGDGVPFYARVEFPDPPPFANAKPIPKSVGPHHPWLTRHQCRAGGFADPENLQIGSKRNPDHGGFMSEDKGLQKIGHY